MIDSNCNSLFDGRICKGCGLWLYASEYRIIPSQKCVQKACDPGCEHEEGRPVDDYCADCVLKRNFAMQVSGNNRRARYMNIAGVIQAEEWEAMCRDHSFRCVLCNEQKTRIVMDHIHPMAKGGLNVIENIQPLCRRCNGRKGKKLFLNLRREEVII